jgi:outer membrane protein assembly factor BamB
MENSIAIYKNFSYFVDNTGYLHCIDLNTLTPVWIRNVTDDTDSTIAIEDLGGSKVSLYTACEVDHQGANGYSYVRKINALTGELLWENKYQCTFSETNGGALASPVVGKNDISNLVIFNIAKAWNTNGGKLIAFDKETGKEIWVINLDRYCWSSPVDIYTKDGKSYIIQCDSGGYMYLIEGQTGEILDKIALGGNVEGSPAVYEDMIVVGTRGQRILGIKVK